MFSVTSTLRELYFNLEIVVCHVLVVDNMREAYNWDACVHTRVEQRAQSLCTHGSDSSTGKTTNRMRFLSGELSEYVQLSLQ